MTRASRDFYAREDRRSNLIVWARWIVFLFVLCAMTIGPFLPWGDNG